MTLFCHGKFFVKTKLGKEDVVKDAERRILEAKISNAARNYFYANGDKAEKQVVLTELSVKFLENGGTPDRLDALLNEK